MTNRIDISVSKNGGHTFSDPRQPAAGETGDFLHPVITRHWGSGEHFVFRVRVTGDFRANLIAASVQLSPTSS